MKDVRNISPKWEHMAKTDSFNERYNILSLKQNKR